MKKTKIKTNKQSDNYQMSDWKDFNGLMEDIDNELEQYGLELDMGDFNTDDHWVRIIERKNKLSKIQKKMLKENECPACGVGKLHEVDGDGEQYLWCNNCDCSVDSNGSYTK